MSSTGSIDFSCVQAIEEYARAANLRDDSPLLVRGGDQLTWTVFRWLMRLVTHTWDSSPSGSSYTRADMKPLTRSWLLGTTKLWP